MHWSIVVIGLIGFLWIIYNIFVYARTGVPYIKTPKKRFLLIFQEISFDPGMTIYDLGCGSGDFLFYAETHGMTKLFGFELSPLLVLWGNVKAKIKRSHVRIKYKDFFKIDLRDADTIYIFLVPLVVKRLAVKLKKECRPGTTVICLSDEVPGLSLFKSIDTKPGDTRSAKIYIYKV